MGHDGDFLKGFIRDVPDFPSPGVLFRDITPLLGDGAAWQVAVEALAEAVARLGVDKVAGIEARGFVLGASVASTLGLGFVPIRKAGKLPCETVSVSYGLEYGVDTLEVHVDAAGHGQRVAIVDDVLATGGTAEAAAKLIEETGAEVAGLVFLMELNFLDGRSRLGGHVIDSVLQY